MKKLILVVLVLSGCYTVIKHPEVNYIDSSGEVYTSHISYRSDCARCHSVSELNYFYDLVPAHTASPWAYYNSPWWFWWSGNYVDTARAQNMEMPSERQREFGSHRTASGNSSFTPPPPTRTPPKSTSGIEGNSSSSSMGKAKTTNDRGDQSGFRSSTSGDSREQNKDGNKESEGKRNIGSRRK